jgi:hypothetical protein
MAPFERDTPPTNEALYFPTAEQDLVSINHLTGMIADLKGNLKWRTLRPLSAILI